MPAFAFYIFAAIMLIFGFLVILSRNPVSSALSLVVSFLGLAALFIGLNAYFIGIIQILVYAGAVMVLFLVHHHAARPQGGKGIGLHLVAVGGGVILVIAFVVQLSAVLWDFKPGERIQADVPIQFEQALEARGGEAAKDAVADDLREGTLPEWPWSGNGFLPITISNSRWSGCFCSWPP